uniref:Retrotrans_gag domain-containing protein n=1 Tax=Heterorhabditis bacteriophora TaxID=37862 RepID=A0A1I7W7Z7_HETBA
MPNVMNATKATTYSYTLNSTKFLCHATPSDFVRTTVVDTNLCEDAPFNFGWTTRKQRSLAHMLFSFVWSFIFQSIPFTRLLPTIIVYVLYLCTFLSCTQVGGTLTPLSGTAHFLLFLTETVNSKSKILPLKWDKDQYLHFISRLLVGRASAWLELADESKLSTWRNLKEAMILEFTSVNVREQARQTLLSATKKTSESMLEFVARIKRLAKLVYDGENDIYVRDFVVRGLPLKLQEKIRHKQIRDRSGIINMMERYEAEHSEGIYT